jgi:DNA-binding NtrC family response regulator
MLVDDEPYILEALIRQLRNEPYQVDTFQDPLKALESVFQEGEFAIIVSDNQMPGLKGLELLKRIKEFAPQARRVLLTGHTELNDAIEAFNDGVIHRFINKPWDTEDLISVLREEIGTYRNTLGHPARRSSDGGADPEAHGRMQQTVEELKQALTQVALYEDSNQLRRLRVAPRIRRMSFLVVDDNPKVRKLLVKTLQGVGIPAVNAVGSTEEALRYLRQVPSMDVILSEWNLPDLDGMALFDALRAGQATSRKGLFILMTTREHREAVEFALKAGVDYYLIKPFHMETLIQQIEKRLRPVRKDSPESRMAKLRGLHFVICNIDQDSRYKIQQTLLINGIGNVTIADSGIKALRVVQERKVDVLILDCNVVDVYLENLRPQLEELSGNKSPPSVVITSVSPVPEEFERVYEAGIMAFLPGPIQQRDLFDAVFKALEADDRYDILDASAE